MRQGLKKTQRIKRRKDLQAVFRRGRFGADSLMSLYVQANPEGRSRMAVTVSSRHGKAAQRNRIKRICREAFRTCRVELPDGYDYVLRPRPGVALSVEAVRKSLRALAARLAKGGES